MAHPEPGVEMTAKGFGGEVNVRNIKDASTGLLVVVLALLFGLGVAVWFHEAAAQKREDSAAAKLAESNDKVAKVLQETNTAAKENSTAVVNAIKSLAQQTKIVACLNDPALRNRSDAYEFCKRAARWEDR